MMPREPLLPQVAPTTLVMLMPRSAIASARAARPPGRFWSSTMNARIGTSSGWRRLGLSRQLPDGRRVGVVAFECTPAGLSAQTRARARAGEAERLGCAHDVQH